MTILTTYRDCVKFLSLNITLLLYLDTPNAPYTFKVDKIPNYVRCMDNVNGKSVNILWFEMIVLSRKPSRSNFTNPYPVRVYNLKASILRESHMLIII